ncbi:hypothetical protein DYU11_19085 [Fibrisoma montanum]|uniref:Uncharacterized protein n=1 Tax=Fibrisoma montanum TaxID=2305895 RepID=A0A418M6D7_9BACT|nr:hypothetical protein [Fibrisoma montanum]RIV21508.1 hypothetical protein DYU11_19085 [Fibrisoma montanum]
MVKEQLLTDIENEPPNYITSKWVVERVPFIFNGDIELYIDWKERLSLLIGVDSKSIVFTGSSAVGFSLNPEKNFKPFDESSDVDVAIISTHYFNISWHYLRNIGTDLFRLKPKEKNAIDDHRQRLIYWGTIATDKIVQLLPFGKKWVDAIDNMRTIEPTKDREINFRIYKDFEALRSYQTGSIKKLKDTLLKP